MPFQHHSIFICTLKQNNKENKKAKWLNFERAFQMQYSCLFLERQIGKESERDGWAIERLLKKILKSRGRNEKTEKKRGRNTFMGDKDSDATDRGDLSHTTVNATEQTERAYGVSTRQKAVLD